MQQEFEGEGRRVKGQGSKAPSPVRPPLLQEMSNSINGLTSGSPSRPFNHAASHCEGTPLVKEGFSL